MKVPRRPLMIVTAVAGVGLIVLGLVLVGLDAADKLASVGSLFVGLAALAVALVALRKRTPDKRRRMSGKVKGGSVAGTAVGVEGDRSYDDIVGVVDVGDIAEGGTVIGARLEDKDV
ncbi:hypothetical protein [Actinokineospora sp. HUAS TT18]|uniref:hypothetical protein n=1 Tax=Actinokineospora sp. HUAS TT18 TaxID=3447451 RepID=UPI003F520A53